MLFCISKLTYKIVELLLLKINFILVNKRYFFFDIKIISMKFATSKMITTYAEYAKIHFKKIIL